MKQAFADPDLARLNLSSANSINIGRLLPQSVYYVYAASRLADVAGGEKVVFSVPSGNFGDLMGGLLASRMGLAGGAVRHRDQRQRRGAAVPGDGRLREDRAVAEVHLQRDERRPPLQPRARRGSLRRHDGRAGERARAARHGRACAATCTPSASATTRRAATIADAYRGHGTILEPHGAVGWAGLQHLPRRSPGAGERDGHFAGDGASGQVPGGDPRAHPGRARGPEEPRRASTRCARRIGRWTADYGGVQGTC